MRPMPARKASKPEPPRKLSFDESLKENYPAEIKAIVDMLRLVRNFNYVLYFQEIPDGRRDPAKTRGGMVTSITPEMEMPDGSRQAIRPSVGMFVDFMLSIENSNIDSSKMELVGDIPAHKM